jgi:hypothetical protein
LQRSRWSQKPKVPTYLLKSAHWWFEGVEGLGKRRSIESTRSRPSVPRSTKRSVPRQRSRALVVFRLDWTSGPFRLVLDLVVVRGPSFTGFDLPLNFHPMAIRAPALLVRSRSLDRRKVEFSGLVMPAGWLRRRESSGKLGACCRWPRAVDPRCSTYANPPTFPGRRQGQKPVRV